MDRVQVPEKPQTMNYSDVVQGARDAFATRRTLPIAFRAQQLRQILRLLDEHRERLVCAQHTDLRKSEQETMTLEVMVIKNEVKNMLAHMEEWAKPEKPQKAMANMLDDVSIYAEPYGVVLVIGAWNYPLQLSLLPLASAIAAGNCAVLKPSEMAPVTASLIADLLPLYLDPQCYPVVLGGVPETTQLLRERFDYVFFTGSTHVGKIVREAANKHLTPVTLELGGKSPVYLAGSADLRQAVKRILWGKFVNAGQTCIAPDYILCSKKVQQEFVTEAQKVLKEWYGEDVRRSPDLCRIITDQQYQRLVGYLLNNGRIAVGGEKDAAERFIAPTILVDVQRGDPIMKEEIFGPILPIVTVDDAQEAVKYINSGEKPLAFYVFTAISSEQRYLVDHVSCGGVCVNDTLMHGAVDSLPFGGVGNSGMGAYHGVHGFNTFTHRKSVLVRDTSAIGERLVSVRYPPYSKKKMDSLLHLISIQSKLSFKYVPHFLTFVLGVAVTFACLSLARKI